MSRYRYTGRSVAWWFGLGFPGQNNRIYYSQLRQVYIIYYIMYIYFSRLVVKWWCQCAVITSMTCLSFNRGRYLNILRNVKASGVSLQGRKVQISQHESINDPESIQYDAFFKIVRFAKYRATMAPLIYGGKNISSSSQIVFSNGLLDPWSTGGITKSISDRFGVFIYFLHVIFIIKNSSHISIFLWIFPFL